MVFLMLLLDLNYYKTIEAYTCLSLWEKAGSQVTAMIWFIACIAGIILLKVEEIKSNVKWERQVQTQRRGLKIFSWKQSIDCRLIFLYLLLMFTININQVNQ